MTRIAPHSLWVGHAGDARDTARWMGEGIEAVVQLAGEEPPLEPPRDVISLRIPIADGAGDRGDRLGLAVRSVAALLASGVPTLVCCGMGMRRAPCVAAAAMAIHLGEPAEASLARIARLRAVDISPELWAEVVSSGRMEIGTR